MLFCFFAILSKQSTICTGGTPPIASGNGFYQWVSNLPNINLREETPVQITETPTKTVSLKLDEISNFLTSNGYSDKSLADDIQKRLRISAKMSTSFNTFNCDDMSSRFYSLDNSQKNEQNFWNKIITRTATLIKADRINNTVKMTVKKVQGQMKKRWAQINKKGLTSVAVCTTTTEICNYVTTPKSVCKNVPVQQQQCMMQPSTQRVCTGFGLSQRCTQKTVFKQNCKPITVYRMQCTMEQQKERKCHQQKSVSSKPNPYYLVQFGFSNTFNSTEVAQMFNSVQNQMKSRLYL